MKAMFGQDVMLVHSSGVILPSNEYGFLMESLQHGESYFLVKIIEMIHFLHHLLFLICLEDCIQVVLKSSR